jgi:phosphoribosylpyrophosphate synthetase
MLLVDEMTGTVKTLENVSKLLKTKGAKNIKAAVARCIFAQQGYDSMLNCEIDSFCFKREAGGSNHAIHRNSSIVDLF